MRESITLREQKMDKINFEMMYRLKNKTHSKEYVIGFLISTILHKNLFSTNEQVSRFIELVFGLTLLPYAVRSRTIMCAKISRILVSCDGKQVSEYGEKSANYIIEAIKSIDNNHSLEIKKKRKSTKNATTNLDLWVTGILNKEK